MTLSCCCGGRCSANFRVFLQAIGLNHPHLVRCSCLYCPDLEKKNHHQGMWQCRQCLKKNNSSGCNGKCYVIDWRRRNWWWWFCRRNSISGLIQKQTWHDVHVAEYIRIIEQNNITQLLQKYSDILTWSLSLTVCHRNIQTYWLKFLDWQQQPYMSSTFSMTHLLKYDSTVFLDIKRT